VVIVAATTIEVITELISHASTSLAGKGDRGWGVAEFAEASWTGKTVR
jgi:hypothetical protein